MAGRGGGGEDDIGSTIERKIMEDVREYAARKKMEKIMEEEKRIK